MPVPSYRASSINGSAAADTAPIGNRPTGTTNGDVLLACVYFTWSTTATTVTSVPAGWTLLDSTTSGNGRLNTYWKTASSEPATWSWGTSSGVSWEVQVVAVQDPGDPVTPIDVTGIQANAASANCVAPSVNTTLPNGLMVGFFGTRASTTFTPDAGMTEAQDGSSVPAICALETAWQAIAATGATGTRTAVAGASAVNIGWIGVVKGLVVVPPTVVGYRASTTNAGVTTASLVGNLPPITANGDALYAGVWTGASSGNPTISAVPAGWALLDTIAAGSSARLSVYWKIAASEPASWTWTASSSVTAWVVQVIAVQNPGSVTPTDVSGIQANPSSSVTAPSVTTTRANGLLIGFFGTRVNTTFTPDASMTEVQDQPSGVLATLETAWQTLAAAGPTGTRVATAAGAANSAGWLGVVLAPLVASTVLPDPFFGSL